MYIFVLLSGLFNLKTKYDESDNVMVRASRVVTDKLQDIFSKWTTFCPPVTIYGNLIVSELTWNMLENLNLVCSKPNQARILILSENFYFSVENFTVCTSDLM